MIFAPRTDRSQLWLALLIASIAMLLLLAAMLWQQTRPVPMHDLHLAEGEKLRCVSYAPYHRPGQTPLIEDTRIEREQIAADLAALAKMATLTSVSVRQTRVTDAGVAAAKASRTNFAIYK